MSLNWKEIDLVLSELDLPGMQIQKVHQSSFDLLAVHVYGRSRNEETPRVHLVLVSPSPGACRMHETFQAVPKSEKPLRFAEFLKARIVNGHIEETAQLGDNRIVRLVIRRGESLYNLYIRLWSNAANVILTDEEGTILDAMKRLPKKGEITGGQYRPESSFAASPDISPLSKTAAAGRYEIRDIPGEGSFNKRIDKWYADQGGGPSLEQLREEVRRLAGKRVNRLEAALDRLREKEADYAGGGRFREYGDCILSNSAAITPGASWFEVPSEGENSLVRIELDPRKNPAENAQGYYEKYRKAKSGLSELRDEITAGEKELAALQDTEKRLMAEANPFRLERLLVKFRKGRAPDDVPGPASTVQRSGKPRPGLSFADGDWLILVGRDAAENDELLRRHVKGNDLWLHVRDWAGSYVFIKNRPGKTVPLEILLDAGSLALFYSKGRNNRRGELYYTQVKHLRRVKNGPKGLVLPSQEKNLSLTLDDERLKKLESARLRY